MVRIHQNCLVFKGGIIMADIGIAIFMIIGFSIIIWIYCAARSVTQKFNEDEYRKELMNNSKKKDTN